MKVFSQHTFTNRVQSLCPPSSENQNWLEQKHLHQQTLQQRYLLSSQQVSQHRKQTSIADAQTDAVFLQNLESTPQINSPEPTRDTVLVLILTHAAQSLNITLRTPSVIELPEPRPSPDQVSLAGAVGSRGRSFSLLVLLAETSRKHQRKEDAAASA